MILLWTFTKLNQLDARVHKTAHLLTILIMTNFILFSSVWKDVFGTFFLEQFNIFMTQSLPPSFLVF